MERRVKNIVSLLGWIATLILIGSTSGFFMRPEVRGWYTVLNRAPLTPPSYIFGMAWTILYVMIAGCGWIIWRQPPSPRLTLMKRLYVTQLILNWSWTPLFFHCHLTGAALICLLAMDIIVSMLIYVSYPKVRRVSLLISPYLGWILFATYLNFYIWKFN